MVQPALTAIIAGCVQLFYAWRILLLTKYKSITILVVLSTITAIIAGIDTAVLGQRHPLFSDWPGKFHIEFGTWLGASLLADLVIAATLLRFLWKRKTGDVAMDHVVNRIFMMTLQTGLLTSVVAFADLIVVRAVGTVTVLCSHLILNTPLASLYLTSFMSLLNANGTIDNSRGYEEPQNKDIFTTVDALELSAISATEPSTSTEIKLAAAPEECCGPKASVDDDAKQGSCGFDMQLDVRARGGRAGVADMPEHIRTTWFDGRGLPDMAKQVVDSDVVCIEPFAD
ncbi:hypothetical protein HWV62_6114 [Athelia sp. TMB]|nr:hypothetical protein HWV62_6114 [Athelia sp. TMB]